MLLKRMNESSEVINNLASFKRYLQDGGRLRLVKHMNYIEGDKVDTSRFNKNIGVVRVPVKVQTNGFYLAPEDNSTDAKWMEYGKASDWSFNGNIARYDDHKFASLTFELVD